MSFTSFSYQTQFWMLGSWFLVTTRPLKLVWSFDLSFRHPFAGFASPILEVGKVSAAKSLDREN